MRVDYTGAETIAMQLSIPKTHRVAFLRFIRLSPPAMREVIQSVKNAKPETSLQLFASQLSNDRLGISHEVAYGIVKFLASLYRYRSELDIPPKEFLDDFIAAAKDEVRGLPDSEKTDWESLGKSVSALLKAELPLALTAKASELSAEHQRRLCPLNCRILSDARPIFVGDPTKDPSAVLIQHELKIAYHQDDGDVKEFYVAMDGDDVRYLQTLLCRAEQKEKSIRRIVKKTGLSVLGDEVEE